MARLSLIERFWNYTDTTGGQDACWPWGGVIGKCGYGEIYVNGGSPVLQKAHRFAYALLIGPIPEGAEVDHTCHTKDCPTPDSTDIHRRCVNPRHLEAVSHSVNVLRSTSPEATHAYMLRTFTHCPSGHEYTPENIRWELHKKNGALGRHCRECNRIRAREWRARRTAKNAARRATTS